MGSEQYFNMPLDKSVIGCMDDWNSLDHFDPTADSRRMISHFMYLRTVYNALQDGFNLVQRGNWTYMIQRPGSNETETEMGLWSASRSGISGVQTLTGNHTDQVWLLFTNENSTQTYQFDCKGSLWISSPYQSGTIVRNLFAPFEQYTLQDSLSSYNNDGKAPYYGCLNTITMDPYGYKALVPLAEWVGPRAALTSFSPGHDARLDSSVNSSTVTVRFEFNVAMDCDSITSALSLNMSSSGKGSTPSFSKTAVSCGAVTNPAATTLPGDMTSAYYWSVELQNVPDGILALTLNKPAAADGTTTNVCLALLIIRCRC